uniref:Tubulin--tyrosine ligase-like protein 12 n=1 Tax=Diabrotica virgifera virgifera TaxID=50390 RepID=A0A6P7GS82_DIAVI
MGHDSEITAFLNFHKDQLMRSGVPEHLWKSLYKKLVKQTFDASSTFDLLKIERDDDEDDVIRSRLLLQASKDIKLSEPDHIYLIDHAWTYKVQDAKKQLVAHDALRERLCNVFDIDITQDKYEIADSLFEHMWKINNYYCISNNENVEDRLPIWYIMDEVGIAVIHSDDPNCRIVPFVYVNDQITYSILFPIKDIQKEDIICRDFGEGITDKGRRDAFLVPWVPKLFDDDVNLITPSEEYFLSGHIKESLPDLSKLENNTQHGNVLKVFSQYSLVNMYVTDPKFSIAENEEEADILWYTQHFKDFQTLSETSGKFVNQFPFEYVLTVKDLLCIICRRKTGLNWVPTSYNLMTELPNFVSYFQKRQQDGKDNYWIVKPFNLARGLDMHITDNLEYILKVSHTGPKIAQKYITNPVLFYRPDCNGKVKFDIRYVFLLESVKPLKAHVYKNFFLRFANKTFELNNFEDYEKHFTVMNYTENANLKHMKCIDFIINWMHQYPDYNWEKVENSIFKMLKELLECATMVDPPCGLAHSPQSRALYAADIMLEWTEDKEIQPKLLEINFTPDCKRACDYYPDFYNDIFSVLFLNESKDTIVQL